MAAHKSGGMVEHVPDLKRPRGAAALREAVALLRTDVLHHIVTLKMIQVHGADVTCKLVRHGGRWALLTVLPTRVSPWDRETYPFAESVVFLDGNDWDLERPLLAEVPPGDFIVKTGDDATRRYLEGLGAPMTSSWLSFTGSGGPARLRDIGQGAALSDELVELFGGNGYGREELESIFEAGARWFSVCEGGRPVSACFVYCNYDTVWEVAGVHTLPVSRRRGHARRVVVAALGYLQEHGLAPRYQVKSDNLPSISLAVGLGLKLFQRTDHYAVRRS